MLAPLCLLSTLFVLLSTSNAEDGLVLRLPARVAYPQIHNLLLKPAGPLAATPFKLPAQVACMELDATVGIGTPAKSFRLLANMLDGDSWLVGDPEFADVFQLYNASESSTATNLSRPFKAEVLWMEGAVNGSIYADILKIDLSDGKLIEVNQSFGVAEAMMYDAALLLYVLKVDGFLGLAPLDTTPNGVPSLLQTLASTHNITTTTVWIESWSNSSVDPLDDTSSLNASITFGGLDSEHCNSAGWISAKWAIPQQWAIKLESIAVSTGEKQAVNTEIYFMAGLPVSVLPKEHVDFIAKSVNARTFDEATYSVPCNQLAHGPSIELTFASHPDDSPVKMQLAPKDYIIQSGGYLCMLAFAHYPDDTPGPKPLILGSSFFNRYCVAIDTHEGLLKFTESLKP